MPISQRLLEEIHSPLAKRGFKRIDTHKEPDDAYFVQYSNGIDAALTIVYKQYKSKLEMVVDGVGFIENKKASK